MYTVFVPSFATLFTVFAIICTKAIANTEDHVSDLQKLLKALEVINGRKILSAFGLANLPPAHFYGIVFGIIVFVTTLTAVFLLLLFGGTFKRLEEQEISGAPLPDSVAERESRALLLERLLDARERMMAQYPEKYSISSSSELSPLSKIVMNVSPNQNKSSTGNIVHGDGIRNVVDDISGNCYEENYAYAYRRCQDKPGGKTLSGVPEARFEAYARAYAGCGIHTSMAYRRSYARMYEAVCCVDHSSEKKYSSLFDTHPEFLHGRTVRLELLDSSRHGNSFFRATSGEAHGSTPSYNPNRVWAFVEHGPFDSVEKLIASPLFRTRRDGAAFAAVEAVSEKIISIIRLTNDDPANLSLVMEPPITAPSAKGTVEEIESCFLLLDKLFALGYRRVELSIDSKDMENKKLPSRLGFTQEGLLPKHRICKEASRDSLVYGMLNSDWDKGARAVLFKKLHGAAAQKSDASNDAKEGEWDEQQRVLREKRKNLD